MINYIKHRFVLSQRKTECVKNVFSEMMLKKTYTARLGWARITYLYHVMFINKGKNIRGVVLSAECFDVKRNSPLY